MRQREVKLWYNNLDMGHTLDTLTALYRSLNANIFTVDYRGFGSSKGSPDEKGLTVDADTVITCCLKLPLINKATIFLYGKSLGAALAILTALKYKVHIQGLILDSPFTSIDDLVKENYPKLSCVRELLLRNHWPNLERIEKVESPLMILSRKDKYETCLLYTSPSPRD
eukprot:TRINITY_DN9322_c0_g1_i6.p1 TRINITY_DN9322_c0_g1~~TRINITY_DN9322_c0_g1_i6.p1  ORF type:complete len:169 (+),score=30.12 TRINITY_DN9322_c0_g1_i6:447-953(+)